MRCYVCCGHGKSRSRTMLLLHIQRAKRRRADRQKLLCSSGGPLHLLMECSNYLYKKAWMFIHCSTWYLIRRQENTRVINAPSFIQIGTADNNMNALGTLLESEITSWMSVSYPAPLKNLKAINIPTLTDPARRAPEISTMSADW